MAELVRRTIRDFSAYRRGIQNEKYTGSNPVLTTYNLNKKNYERTNINRMVSW